MAYQYNGPSMAHGGRLVKKARSRKAYRKPAVQRAKRTSIKAPADKPKRNEVPEPDVWTLTTMQMAEALAPGWDEKGWHGGGMCKVRNLRQRTRPCKGNTRTGRQAHPNLLHLTK